MTDWNGWRGVVRFVANRGDRPHLRFGDVRSPTNGRETLARAIAIAYDGLAAPTA